MCNVIKTFKRKGLTMDVYVLGRIVRTLDNFDLCDSFYLMGVFASLEEA